MVDINYIRTGNWLLAQYGEKRLPIVARAIKDGKVGTRIDGEEKWFDAEDLNPILVDENWLNFLGFEAGKSDSGEAVFNRGPFTLSYPDKNNRQLSKLECMGEYPRTVRGDLSVHVLQNHYDDMIKVPMPL